MPGAFSRALKDNQYLKPLTDSLLAYKQKLDEQEGRKKLLDLMGQLGQTTKRSFQTQGGGISNVEPGVQGDNLPYNRIDPIQNTSLQENIPNLQNKLGTQTQGLNLNVPNQPGVVLPSNNGNLLPFSNRDKRSDVIAPGTQTIKPPTTFDPRNNTGDYKQATDEIRSSFADILSKAILDPTIDTTKLEQIIKLAEQKIPTAPTRDEFDYKEVDGNLVRINKRTGSVIPVYEKKKANDDKEISTYTGEDGYQYTTMKGKDGKPYEIKSENKVRKSVGNNIKIDLGTKEEKWKDVSDLISAIQTPTYGVTGDKGETIIINKTPEQKKKERLDLYNVAIGKLVPSAKVWYDTKIKGKKSGWGREDLSQEDFLAEIEQGTTPDAKTGNIELSPEAAQDLLDFMAFRPEIFPSLSDKNYKAK